MLLLRNGYDCNLFVAFENGVSVVWMTMVCQHLQQHATEVTSAGLLDKA